MSAARSAPQSQLPTEPDRAPHVQAPYHQNVSSGAVKEKRYPAGAQTLARGLHALKTVATSADGMTAVDLAEFLEVHRTIAYRILSTLCEAGLLARGKDGRYRGASGLVQLAEGGYGSMRAAALPILQTLADQLRTTVTLFVRDGNTATALAVVESAGQSFRMAFAQGNRHTLDQGSAAHAIRSLDPPHADDSVAVRTARDQGYSTTSGEVEPNLYGLAVPVPGTAALVPACINLVSNRGEVAETSLQAVVAAAVKLADELQNQKT